MRRLVDEYGNEYDDPDARDEEQPPRRDRGKNTPDSPPLVPNGGASGGPAPRQYTDAERDFLRRNPGDVDRMAGALSNPDGEEDWEEHPEYDPRNRSTDSQNNGGGNGGGRGGGSSMSAWLGQGQQAPAAPAGPDYTAQLNQQNALLQQLFERQVAEQTRITQEKAARDAELKTRQDALYGQLQGRAQQSTQLDPNDPIIKAQVDAYRAEQERAFRNVRGDAAESGNALRPTQDRMAGERVAQGVASMQAELMARELSSRRAEISDALSSMGGILTVDQQTGLQRELASLDNMIRQQQVNAGNRDIDLQRELGLGQLGLGWGNLNLDTELGRGDLDLRGELGRGGLSNDLLRTMLQNQQFYSDLGLRNDTQDDYYNLVNRGRLGNPIGTR